MKRTFVLLAVAIVCLATALAARHGKSAEEPSLAQFAPPGALLYLEAKDFSSLLARWNDSQEKEKWLRSANYQEFSRSRLFLRLKDASEEFSSAAGLPANTQFVSQAAGSQSALALYDIGKLQFLYITRLDADRTTQNPLLQSRAKFESRSASGATFYVRTDPQSGREVAFATRNGYLLLATRVDLIAAALQNVAAGGTNSLQDEAWWTDAISQAGPRGDLRMVLNLEKIVPSPYFRSYWIQKNAEEMKGYRSAVSDLFTSEREYREERVLLKKAGNVAISSAAGQDVAELARLVPSEAGSYRIAAEPTPDASLDLLETKLLSPHAAAGGPSKIAPQVQLTSGVTGDNNDLETRIDQPPLRSKALPTIPNLKRLMSEIHPTASLVFQSTSRDKDDGFVRFHTAVALLGSTDWNSTNVREAVAEFLQPTMSVSNLGLHWQAKANHEELEGLWALALTVHGRYLILSDDPVLLEKIVSKFKEKAPMAPASFIAGFDHRVERESFAHLTTALDDQDRGESDFASRTPEYFSGNLASLSATFGRVSSEKIVVRDAGQKVQQTVTYEWTE